MYRYYNLKRNLQTPMLPQLSFKSNYFPILILLISLFSVGQWSAIPIGNTFVDWAVAFLIILYILRFRRRYFHPSSPKDFRIVSLYFAWLAVCIVRGLFVPDKYWEWKQLVGGSLALALPVFVYIFTYPCAVSKVMNFGLRWGMLIFVLFLVWVVARGSFHFFLAPVFLLVCLFPLIPKWWKVVCVVVTLAMLTADLGNITLAISDVHKEVFENV